MAGAHEQLADLAQWVVSSDGRQSAKRALEGRGLVGVDVGDVLNQTYERVAVRIEHRGAIELDAGKTIAAYAATSLRNIVADMVRSRTKDVLGHNDAAEDDAIEQTEDEATNVEAFVLNRLNETADAIRRRLLGRSIEGEVWPESASLSLITLATDPARDDDLAPRPAAGEEGLWRFWAALYLAGRADLLPDRDDAGDDAARRKNRQRAVAKVRARISSAYAASEAEVSR